MASHATSNQVVDVFNLEPWVLQLAIAGAVEYFILSPFQIIGRLTFLTPSLTTRLIQKIYANIVKFKPFFENLY